MSIDHLDESLRDSVADLALDRPVSEVMARGTKLRRRRTRTLRLGAASVLAVGALGVSALLPTEDNPIAEPAVASFSGGPTNLTPAELDQVSDRCRESWATKNVDGRPRWVIPAGTMPVAAEKRDGLVLTYFRVGKMAGECTLERQPDKSLRVGGQSSGAYKSLPAGQHLDSKGVSFSDPGPIGGPLADISGLVRVSEDVAKLTIETDGQTHEGYIAGGVGLFWLPDGLPPEAAADLTFTAYDDAGIVLEQETYGNGQPWYE